MAESRKLKEAETLRVEPGDVVVFYCAPMPEPEFVERVKSMWPENLVVFLPMGSHLVALDETEMGYHGWFKRE